ncbi:MAG: GNAT family N-acetyltransferase [Bacteriovoracaceae bacterium]
MKTKIDLLESSRLLLEPRKELHAIELYDSFCEKDLYRFMKRDVPPSKEWLAGGFKELERLTSPDGKEIRLGWIGREKKSLKPVGIFEITLLEGEAFVAYTVFKDFLGHGFAVEASQALIDYISSLYKVKRFIIEMDTRNYASMKVAEKLGFKFVKYTNNVTFLKNFVSHEFQFEKLI